MLLYRQMATNEYKEKWKVLNLTDLERRIANLETGLEISDALTDLNLDFTGTDYDTKAECNAVGMLFSDSDTPFPTQLKNTVRLTDTWSHSAGNGWTPSPTTDNEGPALLWPLQRAGDWEAYIECYLNAPSGENVYFNFGAVGQGLHVPFYVLNYAFDAKHYRARLSTNDGDDTYTTRYSGTTITSAGTYEFYLRSINSVLQVYDDQNDSWNDYSGSYGSGVSQSPSHIFFMPYNRAGSVYGTLQLKQFKLTYP